MRSSVLFDPAGPGRHGTYASMPPVVRNERSQHPASQHGTKGSESESLAITPGAAPDSPAQGRRGSHALSSPAPQRRVLAGRCGERPLRGDVEADSHRRQGSRLIGTTPMRLQANVLRFVAIRCLATEGGQTCLRRSHRAQSPASSRFVKVHIDAVHQRGV